jgi:hypothetical protein
MCPLMRLQSETCCSLATGLPGSALAGRVSHPLDDFSEFHESPHDFIPFRPALPGRTVSEFVWGAREPESVGRGRERSGSRGPRVAHPWGASGRTTHPARPSRFALARRAHPKGASGRTAHPTRPALRAPVAPAAHAGRVPLVAHATATAHAGRSALDRRVAHPCGPGVSALRRDGQAEPAGSGSPPLGQDTKAGAEKRAAELVL